MLSKGYIFGKNEYQEIICVPFTNAYLSIFDNPVFNLVGEETVCYSWNKIEIYCTLQQTVTLEQAGITQDTFESNFKEYPFVVFNKNDITHMYANCIPFIEILPKTKKLELEIYLIYNEYYSIDHVNLLTSLPDNIMLKADIHYNQYK